MPPAPLPFLLAVVALAAVPQAGTQAATRHLNVTAISLEISSPCARRVIITPDQAAGQVSVDAVADHDEEVAQLSLTGGDKAKLFGPDECWHPALTFDFQRTMVLTVHVPPAIGLGINEGGVVEYEMGDVGGPLSLDLSGAVKFKSGTVGPLSLDLSGTGAVTISRVMGPLHAELSGYGSLDIAAVNAAAASLELSGKGSAHLGNGTIGKLAISSSGIAQVTIDATVDDATIDVSGAGNVKIAKVTGTVSKDTSGAGSITVGEER